MPVAAAKAQKSDRAARSTLHKRLGTRREEIEGAALVRVNAIADSSEAADPTYVEGLKGAVTAALDYALGTIDHSGEREPPVPVTLLAQARMAARSGVSLDTVLRRYFTGYSLLGYFLIEEASRDGLMGGAELQSLIGTQASLFDHLVVAVSDEYKREVESRAEGAEQRRAETVRRLLGGEPLDISSFGYRFEAWHLGIVLTGPPTDTFLQGLASKLERGLLLVRPARDTVWAWFGGPDRMDPTRLLAELSSRDAGGYRLTVGEPGEGLTGWRLTHRQAAAAFPLAQRGNHHSLCYADVALLASVLQDDLLVRSLRRFYLEPLEAERDGGQALRETLRAYLETNGSLSSAAAALNVSPRTISNRLRRYEELIGRSLHSGLSDVEIALRLHELDAAEDS